MKRSVVISGIVVCFILLIAAFLQASGIVPAIVPTLVPSTNRRGTVTGCGGNGCFQLASSAAAGTTGAAYCDDGSGNLTTSGCTINAVTSTSPVTVNANSTADQQLMELSLTAGYLNSLGRAFDFFGAGVYTTQAAQTPTLEFKIKLCTVSGCGSGTVVTLVDITTTATTANSPNVSWNLRALGTTNATGATGNLEIHGNLTADLGNLISSADTVFTDTNTAVSGNIDLTAALFVDFTIKFSTQPGTPFNAATQREGDVSPGGSTAGGGGGTTVTAAPPYVTIGATKRVAATMFPFTALFSGSFLDANTFPVTASANGDTISNFIPGGAANAWYSVAATASIEGEFIVGSSNASGNFSGIWICDSTNNNVWVLERTNGNAIQTFSATLAGCNAGTPSPFTNVQTGQNQAPEPYQHFKLSVAAGTLSFGVSLDGGHTFTIIRTQAVGTITKAGIEMRSSGANTVYQITNWLSTIVT